MKHSGKLPTAAVGEILHVVNNALSPLLLLANKVGGEDGERAEKAVHKIANYIRSLEHKTEFNSCPFEDTYEKKSA